MQEFEAIYVLLKDNSKNYFGYELLGDYYVETNINQAFLCYEQAWGICEDVEEKRVLEERMNQCRSDSHFQVHPASFIILSYNAREMMIDCLESIRSGCVPGSYEIVVVDNDSRDGIRDYLVEQKDIILQLNDHNTSFAEGCNQGVKIANSYNDIFLLNNDTIVPPLALFYMRLCLYEKEDIGSVGPTSNVVLSWQMAPGKYQTKEQWLNQAEMIHLPSQYAEEDKVWLSGFALLIRRKAWDLVGNLDEQFVRGGFEDTDYGFRLILAGYRNVLCHNAFIYHYGSVSMKQDPAAYNKTLIENEQKLNEKLGFTFNQYMSCHGEMIGMMNVSADMKFVVLEVGCGFGLTLSRIEYQYPNARVFGVEKDKVIAEIGGRISNVICADVESDELPFEKESFDYILLPDVINRFEHTSEVMQNLKRYLREDGKLILLTRNLLDAEMFLGVLKGKFETLRNDIRIHHYYTVNETRDLLSDAGFVPRFLLRMVVDGLNVSEEDGRILEKIKAMPGVTIGEDFATISYIFTATLR